MPDSESDSESVSQSDFESDYEAARAELLAAEVELTHARERVAEMRRQLPGQPVEDYELTVTRAGSSDPPERRRLSELFSSPDRTLVLMQFMLGEAQTSPCPMCSMWADGYNGVAPHLEQRIDFGIVAAADPDELRQLAEARGWTNLLLVSAAGTSLKTDLGMQDEQGNQWPGVSVFRLDAEGRPVHHYTGGAHLAGDLWRGVDLLSPVWHFLDLTPEGRGDWMPSLSY